MPVRSDLEVWKGNTLNRTFRLKAPDGAPIDLTGATLIFRATDRGTELARYTTADAAALSVPTPSNGEVVLTMPAAATRSLPDGAIARYELELRDDFSQTTVAYGMLKVSGGVNDDV